MVLFEITCTTCHARLKVRQKGAIGQILACPKCESMVQVAPPPGWVPPEEPAIAAGVVAATASSAPTAPLANQAASATTVSAAPPSVIAPAAIASPVPIQLAQVAPSAPETALPAGALPAFTSGGAPQAVMPARGASWAWLGATHVWVSLVAVALVSTGIAWIVAASRDSKSIDAPDATLAEGPLAQGPSEVAIPSASESSAPSKIDNPESAKAPEPPLAMDSPPEPAIEESSEDAGVSAEPSTQDDAEPTSDEGPDATETETKDEADSSLTPEGDEIDDASDVTEQPSGETRLEDIVSDSPRTESPENSGESTPESPAAPAAVSAEAGDDPSLSQIEERLNSAAPEEVEFVDAKLRDVVDELSQWTGLSIELDADALAAAGIDSSVLISLHVQGTDVRGVLEALVSQLDLGFRVEKRGLMITSLESSAK